MLSPRTSLLLPRCFVDTQISVLGDSAIMIRFGGEIDLATNRRVHALDARLRQEPPVGIVELVPAYSTLLVHYDPLVITCAQATDWLRAELDRPEQLADHPARLVHVPVRYGGMAGPDLEFVAQFHHVTPAEIIRLHTSRDYTVYMMGFTPGFPYLGRLDEALVTPRLTTPRTLVAAGSVGIAGAQTGIYPIDSPGGWQIIGHTSLKLFDPDAIQPFLFAPGDTVRFEVESSDA